MSTYSVHSLARIGDLQKAIPENVIWQSKLVLPSDGRVLAGSYEIFFRETTPLHDSEVKGTIIFIHGQSFSSSTWLEHSTMQIFSAAGYRCLALDLPGCGKTGGPTVPDSEKGEVLMLVMRALDLGSVILVGHSMAGQYIIPLLGTDRIICVIAIALSNTNMIPAPPESINTPILVLWGDRDTSLGTNSASNLRSLPNARLQRVPSAGHACYLSNASFFHSACLNFFEIVQHFVASL